MMITAPSNTTTKAGLIVLILALAGCQLLKAPMDIRTEDQVDLNRFTGDWYVIASIPTPFERNAYNAVESYAPPQGNRIQTTFTFNAGSLDGPKKTYRPVGFVGNDGSNAVWGMQFLWPFKAEYRVMFVDERYERTIVGRRARDYLWIMARRADLDEAAYQELVGIARAEGYDTSKLRRVPHNTVAAGDTQPSLSAADIM